MIRFLAHFILRIRDHIVWDTRANGEFDWIIFRKPVVAQEFRSEWDTTEEAGR